MILDLDIGNSRLKWVRRDTGGEITARGHLYVDQLESLPAVVDAPVSRLRVASVKGDLNRRLDDLCRETWGLRAEYARVEPGTAGLECGYRNPGQLGVDRWLAVLACWRNLSRRALVVDAGSALTIDILADDRHRGGYILPGLTLMADALGAGTWGIALAGSRQREIGPGADTQAAVNNGSLIASIGAVEQAAALSGVQDIILTGGDSGQLRPYLAARLRVIEEPDLVIDGLAVALP